MGGIGFRHAVAGVLIPAVVFAGEVAPPQVALRFVSSFGQKGSGEGQFHQPGGIAVGPLGMVYVADTGNDRVQKFDLKGNYHSEVGGFGWEDARFNEPVGLATPRGLKIYVADSRNDRIQIFGPHLQLLAVVGGRDVEGPHPLASLGGIAVSLDGEIFVSDTDADQIIQISSYSTTDRTFGGYGYGSGKLRRPLGITVGEKGDVYVSDGENGRVAIFDAFGSFKWSLGDGSLSEPSGLCLGPKQTLFVADTGHHRIIVYDLKNKTFVDRFGGPRAGADPDAFNQPRGVAMGPNDVLYVLDSGNSRVQMFRVLVLRK